MFSPCKVSGDTLEFCLYLLLAYGVVLMAAGLLLSSCGRAPAELLNDRVKPDTRISRSVEQDPIIMLYVSKVQEEAQAHSRPMDVSQLSFVMSDVRMQADQGGLAVGVCYSTDGVGFEVQMVSWFWDTASYVTRMSLVRHELGHCAYNLDHRTDRVDIMNPVVLDDSQVTQEVIDEFYKE